MYRRLFVDLLCFYGYSTYKSRQVITNGVGDIFAFYTAEYYFILLDGVKP